MQKNLTIKIEPGVPTRVAPTPRGWNSSLVSSEDTILSRVWPFHLLMAKYQDAALKLKLDQNYLFCLFLGIKSLPHSYLPFSWSSLPGAESQGLLWSRKLTFPANLRWFVASASALFLHQDYQFIFILKAKMHGNFSSFDLFLLKKKSFQDLDQ